MTALTQQLVSAVIEAGSVLFQRYSGGDLQSGATRNSTMKFLQSFMAQRPTHPSTSGRRQAGISGKTEQEVMQTKTSKVRPSTCSVKATISHSDGRNDSGDFSARREI